MTFPPFANSFLSRVSNVEKAAEVAKRAPPKVVELSEEAKTLPLHIRSVTDAAKLNAQTPFFKCPSWAALPALACHLRCSRDGVPLPALGLDRFPFYLFGKNDVCDYVLEHLSISNIHAVLVFHGEHQCFVLMDLGSTNGVKLNGTRIEKKRPVPAPVGSCIHFGFSSRLYKICLGPPPSSKRLREDQEAKPVEREGIAPALRDSVANGSPVENVVAATSIDGKEEKAKELITGVGHNAHKTGVSESTHSATAALMATTRASEQTSPVPPPLPTLDVRHLYHVLIKHKDVRRPISLAPRNKGDKITRSKADAVALAQAILARHGDGNVVWSLAEFTAVVCDYSECSSAKRNGDLGMVESGTYTEDFDTAAFALGKGMVSAPVETELGVHLIYRAD